MPLIVPPPLPGSQREHVERQREETEHRRRELEALVEKLSATTEHQRAQIGDYVERVGAATIEHASLSLQIKTLEGERR